MAPTLIGRQLKDFQIVRLLGRGSIGQVYLAEHVRLPRRAVIKVLRPELAESAEVLVRFRREAEVASQIGHHHVVEVLDYDVSEDGLAYIVMEHLEGEDLGARIARERIELPVATSIVRQTAEALSAAHKHGVVHRDLKPRNIFLCPRQGDPTFVKVLDFGISKVASAPALTQEMVTLGTPLYMAPEQALGRHRALDGRTDQFALGCVAYEMLSGQAPFQADTIASILYRVVHDEPDPLREIAPEVPAAVVGPIMRALSKRPADRFPGVIEFAAALSAAAQRAGRVRTASLPPLPPPPSDSTLTGAIGQRYRHPSDAPVRVLRQSTPTTLMGLEASREPQRYFGAVLGVLAAAVIVGCWALWGSGGNGPGASPSTPAAAVMMPEPAAPADAGPSLALAAALHAPTVAASPAATRANPAVAAANPQVAARPGPPTAGTQAPNLAPRPLRHRRRHRPHKLGDRLPAALGGGLE